MNLADSVLGRIDDAAKDGDWAGATFAAEHMLASLARGVLAGDVSLVDTVAADAASGASRIVLMGDVDATPSATSTAWLMKAAAALAAVARDAMQRPEDGDTRTRILKWLAAAGPSGLTNTELVARCRRSAETMSRVLRRMLQDGEIERESAGRMVRNWMSGARDLAKPAFDRAGDHRGAADCDGADRPVRAGDLVACSRIASVDRREEAPAGNDAARLLEGSS